MNIFDSSLNSHRKLKNYSVEVITYDGDSYTEEIAASMYDNGDYTMIQGCYAY